MEHEDAADDARALARKRAQEAGVAERAQFVEGDMYVADISKATVLPLLDLDDDDDDDDLVLGLDAPSSMNLPRRTAAVLLPVAPIFFCAVS